MNTIIEVRNLSKHFGDLKAVDGISFTVGEGEFFSFLGPNGAGKSTTIKMLITLLRPTGGVASIDGYDIVRQASLIRKNIGYVPQLISVDGSLTAYENLMLMARLFDIPAKERNQRISETLSFLKLEKQANTLVKNFSGGMIRKLEIGQSIIHKPKVLFLDEPTSGLDPVARRDVWTHLLELRDKYNTAIFFATHDMEEADEMSDRVAIINKGKIEIIGTTEELKQKTDKPAANLEDAFIFFSGNSLQENGNFRDIARGRRTAKRLG